MDELFSLVFLLFLLVGCATTIPSGGFYVANSCEGNYVYENCTNICANASNNCSQKCDSVAQDMNELSQENIQGGIFASTSD
jgi:hypothetical protein